MFQNELLLHQIFCELCQDYLRNLHYVWLFFDYRWRRGIRSSSVGSHLNTWRLFLGVFYILSVEHIHSDVILPGCQEKYSDCSVQQHLELNLLPEHDSEYILTSSTWWSDNVPELVNSLPIDWLGKIRLNDWIPERKWPTSFFAKRIHFCASYRYGRMKDPR